MDSAFIIFCASLIAFLAYQGWRISVALKQFNQGSKSQIDAALILHKAKMDVEALPRTANADQAGNANQASAA